MTMLFFLRSSNGSAAPGPFDWDNDEIDTADRRRRKKKFMTLKEIERDRELRKKEEDDLIFLLMHDFEDYDD